MTRDDIIILPDKRLRQRSRRVAIIDDRIKKLANDMIEATKDWDSSRPHEVTAALAAVQIGQLWRVIIIRQDFEDKNSHDYIALINPEIIKAEGEILKDTEGCLSVADTYGLVPRYEKVRVKALDINGRVVRLKASGFLARVLQHEVDHTNGTLFVDHVQNSEFFKLSQKGELVEMTPDEAKQYYLLWHRND